ncbi:MAG: hypothetical protein ACR2QG_03650 [Gammaproteobacteria bacterium]
MTKPKSRYFTEQLDGIAHELSILAIACDIDFFNDQVADRILNNDLSVCGRKNDIAFKKLRHHLMALYQVEEKSIDRIGVQETKEIVDYVRLEIRKLHNLGRPGSAPPLDD